jgi:branched-chain amino acid aminotransferase
VAVAAQLLQDAPGMKALRVATFDDARKAAPDALSPEAKVAAAYLGPLLARKRAIAAGAEEIVLLDRDGNIAEAPTANAFAVSRGVITTPPLGYVLPGITRDAVLAVALAEGITIREESLTREAFQNADEAFLTATSFPIAPISVIDGRTLGGAPGPLTARIAARIHAAQRGEDAAFDAWITNVG